LLHARLYDQASEAGHHCAVARGSDPRSRALELLGPCKSGLGLRRRRLVTRADPPKGARVPLTSVLYSCHEYVPLFPRGPVARSTACDRDVQLFSPRLETGFCSLEALLARLNGGRGAG